MVKEHHVQYMYTFVVSSPICLYLYMYCHDSMASGMLSSAGSQPRRRWWPSTATSPALTISASTFPSVIPSPPPAPLAISFRSRLLLILTVTLTLVFLSSPVLPPLCLAAVAACRDACWHTQLPSEEKAVFRFAA